MLFTGSRPTRYIKGDQHIQNPPIAEMQGCHIVSQCNVPDCLFLMFFFLCNGSADLLKKTLWDFSSALAGMCDTLCVWHQYDICKVIPGDTSTPSGINFSTHLGPISAYEVFGLDLASTSLNVKLQGKLKQFSLTINVLRSLEAIVL